MRRCYYCGAKKQNDLILCPKCEKELEERLAERKGIKAMYSLNIYEDFPNGDYKLLETFYCYARDRADAKLIALRYAQEKYKGKKVSVTNIN